MNAARILAVASSLLCACGPLEGVEEPEISVTDPPVTRTSRTEVFTQEPLPPVDLLFVVDNGSFSAQQNTLGEAFPAWLDALDPYDWHVGIIAADNVSQQGQGRIVGDVLTAATADLEETFALQMRLGNGGPVDEMFVEPALMALSPRMRNGDNLGFRREDAELHLIMVTDEDQTHVRTPAAYSRDLEALGATPLRVHLLTGIGDRCLAARNLPLIQDTFGGAQGNVCGQLADYESFLLDVASWLPTGPDTFALQGVPSGRPTVQMIEISGTILDVVDRALQRPCERCYGFDFDADRSLLRIEPAPPGRAEIRVTYTEP